MSYERFSLPQIYNIFISLSSFIKIPSVGFEPTSATAQQSLSLPPWTSRARWFSTTRIRTRADAVKARYPNQLDYSGLQTSLLKFYTQINFFFILLLLEVFDKV